jgi:hypothetical protein
VYNIFSYIFVHLLVLISYLIAQCTVMDNLKKWAHDTCELRAALPVTIINIGLRTRCVSIRDVGHLVNP